jgi:cyclic pyranopterin phosphate synthase
MQNRRVYFLSKAKVEVVRPIENTEFCAYCTRLRVTSDGWLKPCLMRTDNLVDLLTPLRKGASDEDLTKLFMEAVKRREPYYKLAQNLKTQ